MKGKSTLVVGIIIALLIVGGLCVVTVYGTYNWLESNGPRWEWFICAGSAIL